MNQSLDIVWMHVEHDDSQGQVGCDGDNDDIMDHVRNRKRGMDKGFIPF